MAKPLRSSLLVPNGLSFTLVTAATTATIVTLVTISNRQQSPAATTRFARLLWLWFRMLDQFTVNLSFRSHFSRARPKCFEELPSHTLIWITDYIGTGRLSGLPFMSSSFNARSAEPLADICMPRGSQCCVALIVLIDHCQRLVTIQSRLSSVLTEILLAKGELDRFDARDIFGGRSI